MLRVEHAAGQELYTKGARVLAVALSLISWGIVLFLIISAWIDKISATGYWNEPVKVMTEKPESK